MTGLALATLAPALAAATMSVATAPPAQAAPACTTKDLVTTCTFTYTGGPELWKVPVGIDQATFTVVGAAGGDTGGRPGGRGGGVSATLDVVPGTLYMLNVGGKGASDTDAPGGRGGYNGGGNGGAGAGGAGGGGASDIRTTPFLPTARILVGGGGGGAGSAVTYANTPHGMPGAGGNGGTLGEGVKGGNVEGAWVGAGGGNGGTATTPGAGGGPSGGGFSLYNGCGFWNPAYPVPGAPGTPYTGTGGEGGFLRDANFGHCNEFRGWGGGGGGGWNGGGGGGGGITGGAGGGGGSGHAPAGATATPPGTPRAHGVITIQYRAWQVVPGGGTMSSAPTVAPRPTTPGQPIKYDLFYLNANSQVIRRVITDGMAGPEENLGAVLYPGSTVAAAWRPDGKRLDLFGRGTENALWQRTYTTTGGWGSWHDVSGIWRPPGTPQITADPVAVSTDPASVYVFFRYGDVYLQRYHLVDGQPGVSTYVSHQADSTPAAVALPNGVAVLAYSTYLNFLVLAHMEGDGGLGEVGSFYQRDVASTPAIAVGDDTLIAFRTDGAGLSWLPKSTWVRHDTTAPSPPGSAPALIARPGGVFIVYVRGNDNQLTARALSLG